MATSSIEIKQVHLELVEKEFLEKYVEIINHFGNVFAVTIEEFEHYHDTEDCKFYEVKIDDSSLIGAIYVISKVDRSIATEIALCDPAFYGNVMFEMENENIEQMENTICINFSSNTMLSDICIRGIFRNIYEYSLKTRDMTVDYLMNPTYHVETRNMPCCLDDILEFDEKLFSFGNRKDFIETCARRSDAIYVVKKDNEVTGLGMLSKPVAGKRLFGPVYAVDHTSAVDLLCCLFSYLMIDPSDEKIVAFVPDQSFGHDVLRCSVRRKPVKMWRRKSCIECDVGMDKVVAMGSLLFDIY